MIIYIGNCPLCGGAVHWSTDHHLCSFNPVNDCLCECPYPKAFMDQWADIEDDINLAWKRYQAQIKFQVLEEKPTIIFPKTGKYLIRKFSDRKELTIKLPSGRYYLIIEFNDNYISSTVIEPNDRVKRFLKFHNS